MHFKNKIDVNNFFYSIFIMGTFTNVKNISKYYVLQIVDNHQFFKNNLVIAPIQWFKKEEKSKKVCVYFPEPPFFKSAYSLSHLLKI